MIQILDSTANQRWRRHAAAALLAGAAFALAGCGENSGSEGSVTPTAAAAPVGVGVVEAWTSPVDRTVRLIGSTRAMDTVAVTAQVTGTVSWVGFEDEAFVEDGELLVRLDERRAAADLRAVEARLDRLTLRLDRTEEAFSRGAGNQTELDDARTAVAEAEAEAERARVVLSDHQVRAPFTGRVTRRLVSLGTFVSPGDAVAVLNAVDPIEVAFGVPEGLLAQLRPGLPVRATSVAFGDRLFEGELAAIGAEVDVASRTAEVFARLDNKDGLLRPGLFMTIMLVLNAGNEALIVPESALVTEGNRVEVFVVEDGKAERRRVRVGSRFPGLVEITEGIEPGQTIVTSGVQKLRQGTPVETMPDEDLEILGVIAGAPLSAQPAVLAADVTGRARREAETPIQVAPAQGGGG